MHTYEASGTYTVIFGVANASGGAFRTQQGQSVMAAVGPAHKLMMCVLGWICRTAVCWATGCRGCHRGVH